MVSPMQCYPDWLWDHPKGTGYYLKTEQKLKIIHLFKGTSIES